LGAHRNPPNLGCFQEIWPFSTITPVDANYKMPTLLSVNRTVIQVDPDFSTPRRSHDEHAAVWGKPQGAFREPQGPTRAEHNGMSIRFVRSPNVL
jgi:hypothetical protein